ncbi:uncharacterized protein G2W53_011866 [Senna tora]|uniref:Uncharacterized protein n=1 Tax=Senna tora TaxID=362788 RepID=A0A834WQA4_9FABA|nr:uncharacterized protein G2W53_011866 [Senna tora]
MMATPNSSKSGSSIRRSNTKIVELIFYSLSKWWLSVLILPGTEESTVVLSNVPATSKEGVNDAARARKWSMMLLPVTSMEGVDDGTSYAVQDEQEVEAGMGVIDDDTAKGSSYMRERSQRWHYRRDGCERVDDVTHPSWCSACEDSKDEVECKKLTMVLTTVLPASMEGVGATKDSREQSIPCAVVRNDNKDEQEDALKGLMMVLLPRQASSLL